MTVLTTRILPQHVLTHNMRLHHTTVKDDTATYHVDYLSSHGPNDTNYTVTADSKPIKLDSKQQQASLFWYSQAMVQVEPREGDRVGNNFDFIPYTGAGRSPKSEKPFGTWHTRGLLALNGPAFRDVGSPESIELFYDPQHKAIGVRAATQDTLFPCAVKKNKRSETYRIGAGGFATRFGIPLNETKRIPGEMDGDMLVLRLDRGIPVVDRADKTDASEGRAGSDERTAIPV
jgi:hypothetical protein